MIGDPLAWLATQAQDWIRAQRIAHRPDAIALSDPMKTLLHSFFDATVLDQARYRTVATIQNPPFLEQAVAMGIPRAIDFTRMAGITFQDVFLVSRAVAAPNPLALVFHELVHVVQYAILGVDEFARQYVYGLATGGFSCGRRLRAAGRAGNRGGESGGRARLAGVHGDPRLEPQGGGGLMTGPTPYWYHLVPQENVRPADLVPLSDKVARWAARDLGLRSAPTVVWFTRRQRRGATSRAWAPHYLRGAWPRPGEPPPPPYALTDEEALEAALNRSATPTLYGRVVGGYPSVVFLRTVRSPYTVARHLLHECRHVWQFANRWFPGRDLDVEEAQAEGDAEIYAGLAHPIMLQALARSSEVVR